MKAPIPREISEAARRLGTHQDFDLIRRFLLHQFDKEMLQMVHGAADNEAYVRMGVTRALQFVLNVLQGNVKND